MPDRMSTLEALAIVLCSFVIMFLAFQFNETKMQFKNRLKETSDVVAVLKQEVISLNASKTYFESQLKESSDAVVTLKKELHLLNETNMHLENSLKETTNMVTTLRKDVDLLNEDKKNFDNRFNETSDAVTSLQTEVEFLITGENLALGKQSIQSSTSRTRNASLANDGQKTQDHGSCNYVCCTHTVPEPGAWWTVDLGDVYEITNVVILGRTDCCQHRLSKFYVEAIKPHKSLCSEFSLGNWSNFDQGEVSECHFEESNTEYLNASCKPDTVGQFLRIRLTEQEPLTLCEVEVYGYLYHARPLYLGGDTQPKCGVEGSYYKGQLLVKSHSRSVIECTAMCSLRDGCFAANLKANGKECDLMGKLPGASSQYLIIDAAWRVYFNL